MVPANDVDQKNHFAQIVFLHGGLFVVSVCATLTSKDAPSGEETWWAPHARVVRVGTMTNQCS